MRTATVQFEQSNQKENMGILPVVGVGAIIFLIVGLVSAVVLITQQPPGGEQDVVSVYTTTPTPTPEPTITPIPTTTPTPAPENVSTSTINDTSYQTLQEYANNAINNTSYQPSYRPSPVPYNTDTVCVVAQQLGWTYGCGMSPEQYIQWYNQIHGYGNPVEYSADAAVFDGDGKQYNPKPAQYTYAIGEQFIATCNLVNTGDPLTSLDYSIRASMYNPNTGAFHDFGDFATNHTEILLAKNQMYPTTLYRWQIPEQYMGFNTTGIWDMTFTIKTNDHTLYTKTYEFILGTRGPDGIISL